MLLFNGTGENMEYLEFIPRKKIISKSLAKNKFASTFDFSF